MQKVSKQHEYLFHYTNWSGLVGILESQSLWGTHYKYLNDYSEIVLFKDKLAQLMVPHVKRQFEKLIVEQPDLEEKILAEGGLSLISEHDAKVLVESQYYATGDEIYICSLCGLSSDQNINQNGLLSQWRGYGVGGGFALVFDTLKLEKLLEEEYKNNKYRIMSISDVVYSDDDNKLKNEFSEDLEILARDVDKIFELQMSGTKPEDANLDGFLPFVNCISRYKHHGFKDENEVRIVALPMTANEEKLMAGESNNQEQKKKERKFRIQEDERVPYIELFRDLKDRLPIKKIIVGPHKNKSKRVSTLRVMLQEHDIDITCSDIPFIG
jgi:DUF2971 family protein